MRKIGPGCHGNKRHLLYVQTTFSGTYCFNNSEKILARRKWGKKKHSRKWIPLIKGMEVCKSVSSSPLSVGLHSKSPQLMPENVDSTKPLYYSFSYTYIHFTASMAYPNCQHHYTCTLGSLLSKIKITNTSTVVLLQSI